MTQGEAPVTFCGDALGPGAIVGEVSTLPDTRPAAASGRFPLGGSHGGVHRLGFGTMQLTGPGVWGPPADPAAAVALLRRAADLGVDLFDTADSYGPEVAEELVREALHPYDGITIATKAGLVRTGPDEWQAYGRPEYLRQQCEQSLRRLGVERIDLFQLHRVDPQVPADEQFGALAELQAAGKVAAVGLSEVGVDQIEQARTVVDVSSVQNHYNLADRGSDDVLRYCTEQGIGFIPWAPIASGRLAQPGGVLARVGERIGATPSQVALAWLLQRSSVMLPIPGTANVEHLEENVRAAELALDLASVDELDSAT
ncbi:aldo/keto reductase [Pseudonocardia kunmingensis]|uniref:Aryl-alcohol dehydrogenase-like predicted oxidoreductase n=1 Tax=Pseudonocardia kunmingensis TaxID=630975 RepID=A0A543E3E2_9PSEU|nr:aldo/keto reductase [Pseudonocardia kunmingensis]TQM16092.1 aryl-alcohol dehydrogenase-like predicted oxidoreductase [Pseudonocardia kunmingensis]